MAASPRHVASEVKRGYVIIIAMVDCLHEVTRRIQLSLAQFLSSLDSRRMQESKKSST